MFQIRFEKFIFVEICEYISYAATAAAKSLQSCLTLCDPIDGSPPGSSVPGILHIYIYVYIKNVCVCVCVGVCVSSDSTAHPPCI